MAQPNDRGRLRTKPDHEPLYVASDFFVLRAPVLPADTLTNLGVSEPTTVEPSLVEASSERLAGQRSEGRERLLRLLRSRRVQQAVHVASPSFSASLRGGEHNRIQDRAFSTLLRYLTRMSTRPTPHGLFAGVAGGSFSARASTVLGHDPVRATRTRADMGWLREFMNEVEADERARDLLPVRINDLVYEAGDQLILFRGGHHQGHVGDRVEIALSRPVRLVMTLAVHSPTFGDLLAAVAAEYPTTSPERIRRMLGQLWDQDILLCALQPPRTEPRPDEFLVAELTRLGVSSDVVTRLNEVSVLATEIDGRPGDVEAAVLDDLSARQRDLTPGHKASTYRLDTALAATAELSADVAQAAAEAAETLMRLGSVPSRPSYVEEYHRRFVEAYGLYSELPLLEVLRPETGLGPPNTYQVPPRSVALPWQPADAASVRARDQALVELVAHATRHQLTEIELSDDWFTDLAVWSPDDPGCAPRTSLDLYFQVAARSVDAINAGQWQLVLSALGYNAGLHSVGRFSDLLGEGVVPKMRSHLRAEEELRPDTVFAELNHQAADWLGFNVSIHPGVREYEVSVNAPPTLPPERQIPLQDILLGADSGHFYLRSASLGKRLVVTQSHALSPLYKPNECRALLEFSADGLTPLTTFDWGIVQDAPSLPRLTRGRTVVAPARWSIAKRTFADVPGSADEFFRSCQSWRAQWGVPRHVYLTDSDNRLLLDLEHPLWVDELFREVKRCERESWRRAIVVEEMLPDPAGLWLQDPNGRRHHSEITVPLRLRAPHKNIPSDRGSRAPESRAATRRWMPGERWVHLRLYSAPELQDAIIAGPLLSLVRDGAVAGIFDRWFYIRYADPLPHLRLRFRAHSAECVEDLMARCATWAQTLVKEKLASDLAFTSYDRELERYGGPHAIDAVEEVFSRNSEVSAVLMQLAGSRRSEFDTDILCVVAMHALREAWASPIPPVQNGHDGHSGPSDAVRKRFRELRPILCDLLAPGELRPSPLADTYRSWLGPILERQRVTVESAGREVRQAAERGLLSGSAENILESLIHMQANRLLGIDGERERVCIHLWALALRAIRGRPARASL